MQFPSWTLRFVVLVIAGQIFLIDGEPKLGTCSSYDNGKSYYQKADNLCYNITCQNGREQLGGDHACLNNNLCFSIGTAINLNSCVVKTCLRAGNVIGFRFSKKACSFQNECLMPGTVKTNDCMTYQCVDKSKSDYSLALSIEPVDVRCVDQNGGCHPLGAVISDSPCIEHKCVTSGKKVFFNRTLTTCQDTDNNVCRNLGETWVSGCFVLKCVKLESDTSITLKTDVIEQKC